MPSLVEVRANTWLRTAPQKRGQAEGNAHPRPNPQGAAAAEPRWRKKFYALKGREEQ